MTLKLNGTNSVAAPAYAGDDADTGLQCGTNELKLVTGGSARATVDSSGRLLVGATSGTGKFIVQDSSLPKIQANYADSKHLEYGVGGSGCGFAMTSGHFMTFNHQPYADRGTDNNLTERMRILSSGGLTFNGDTAAANALDDYEEGTFTPVINVNGTAISGITYTRQDGYYVKVGKIVYTSMWVTWSSRTNSSGSTASMSLPVTSYNSSGYRGAIHISTENCAYNGYGFDSGSNRNIGAMAGSHLNQNVAYTELSFTGKNNGGWGSGGISVNGLGSSGGNIQMSGTYMAQ